MEIEVIRAALAWSGLINLGLVMFWFIMLICAHDLVYRLHSKWFKITVEQFDVIHYAGIAGLKILTFAFFIIPYLALRIIA